MEKEREFTMNYDYNNHERMIKGRITHKIQITENFAVNMMQEKVVYETTIPIIQSMGIKLIIEFGTGTGGFTFLLSNQCPDVTIHTFDIKIATIADKIVKNNIFFHHTDILNTSVGMKKYIIQLLKSDEKKLLYCDNGNKKQEVKMYYDYLNKDDFIGVHDWGREILWKDVEPYIGSWERYQWPLLEEHGALSRFWKR